MTANAIPRDTIPNRMVLALGVLLVAVLSAVAVARLSAEDGSARPAPAPLALRTLHFEDRADGGINVADGKTGERIAQVEPGTNGFLRSTLRGLARERKRRDLGSETAFVLAVQPDNRLTLTDPATNRTVDLDSFGPSNATVFRGFLTGNTGRHNTPGIINQQR